MGILDVRRDPALIAADRLTVPGFLKKHSYHTAGFGKWHLGWNVPIESDHVQTTQPISDGPTTRGFDEYHCVDLRYFPPYMYAVNDRFDGTPLREWTDTKNAAAMPPTDADFADALPWTTDATIHYLGQRTADKQRFFAYVAPMVPHTPLSVAKSWQGRSGLGVYADYVMELDAEIGRILAALDRYKLTDDTLVVFTSDNGCSPAANIKELEAKGHFPNERSRGCKADLWEGGHRIPFLVRWPGQVTPGPGATTRFVRPTCWRPVPNLSATASRTTPARTVSVSWLY